MSFNVNTTHAKEFKESSEIMKRSGYQYKDAKSEIHMVEYHVDIASNKLKEWVTNDLGRVSQRTKATYPVWP